MVKVKDLELEKDCDAEKEWLEHHVEVMLAYDEAYEDGEITTGAYVNAVRASLRKLRRSQPQMDG